MPANPIGCRYCAEHAHKTNHYTPFFGIGILLCRRIQEHEYDFFTYGRRTFGVVMVMPII